MSTEKTQALVLRLADFSESSRVVTLFTRDFGQISALAKGAKRLTGPFESALDLLTVSQIVFIRKSTNSLDLLTEAKLISRFRPHGKDLYGLYAGYYLAELLVSLTEQYDPHPILFDQALEDLERLSSGEPSGLVCLRFEVTVLREIGLLPEFGGCAVCETPVTADRRYAYWVAHSSLICESCQQHIPSSDQLSAETVGLLSQLTLDTKLSHVLNRASTEQIRQMRRVFTAAISYTLGRRPKMLKYISP
jgi:DNA repair protein RecO (recombination protein O)